MRIGSLTVEGVLLAANVVLALCLGVALVQDAALDDAALGMTSERPGGSPVLIVVAAGSPADLAVAEPAARALGGALLAVPADGLTRAATAELSEARPDRILVLGGPAVVSEATATELSTATGRPVTRLSGADRFTTAARVATSQFTAPVERLRVMSGDAELPRPTPDRGRSDAPVLLVRTNGIPEDVAAALRRLRPQSIEVSGSPAVVSDAVVQRLQELTTGRVVRLAPTA